MSLGLPLDPRRRRCSAASAWLAGVLWVSAAAAQSGPPGFHAGPWILAPTFGTSYEADSNVFLNPDEAAQEDTVTKYKAGLGAILPFSNSRFRLDYDLAKEVYQDSDFDRDIAQVLTSQVELNFRSGDTLTLRDVYRLDFARADEDDVVNVGDQASFRGQPYNINRWDITLDRDEEDRQGYTIRIRREDFDYEGDVDIGIFEYRGFDNSFEYRQPLPHNRFWLVRYQSRRYNHYEPFPTPPAGVGDPFRKEKTDDFTFGLRGMLGERQPYRFNLGYGRFRYTGGAQSEFDGLVGAASWRLWVGGRTKLDLEAIRRPLPSNFNTHYINNAIKTTLEREWTRFEVGTEIEFVLNDYGDDIALSCDGLRKDSTTTTEAYWNWKVHERVRFELSSFYTVRSSTCDVTEYNATGLETGLRMGWF